MKVALVHDTLTEFGGAERVLFTLMEIFPDAPVYTSFFDVKNFGHHADNFNDRKIITSWADRVWFLKKFYSPLRFITPLLWEQFRFDEYNLVISSSGAYMCKGIITKPDTKHISYIHHQPRYLYGYETARDLQKYTIVKVYAALVNHTLRMWDYLATQRPDTLLTNSHEVQKRIQKFYRRDSAVVYPPVKILDIEPEYKNFTNNYYLYVGRLEKAKHVELLVHAANIHALPLKIIGNGKQYNYLKSIAGKTVDILGKVSDDEFTKLFYGAKAFLNASIDEDFGIANVEALGRGVPVIAYNSGGHKETIEHGKNGFLFDEHTQESLYKQIQVFERFSNNELINMRRFAYRSSHQFSKLEFIKNIKEIINTYDITRRSN